MKEILELCQLVIAGTGTWFRWFLGNYDGPFCTLLSFAVLNGLTGLICAVLDRTASITAGSKYLSQKVLIFGMVGISHILDTQVIGTDSFLRTSIILFYVCTEGISIVRNAEHLGLPIPSRLKVLLEQFHTF